MTQTLPNKYNFYTISRPKIYFDSKQIEPDKKSFGHFISTLTWKKCNNKVGYDKKNTIDISIKCSIIASEKVNIILNTTDSNNIIDEFMDRDKIILQESKSNITWMNDYDMRQWKILQQGQF